MHTLSLPTISDSIFIYLPRYLLHVCIGFYIICGHMSFFPSKCNPLSLSLLWPIVYLQVHTDLISTRQQSNHHHHHHHRHPLFLFFLPFFCLFLIAILFHHSLHASMIYVPFHDYFFFFYHNLTSC